MALYGYESWCGAAFGEIISNCDSSKLGRLSYESPDVRGMESVPPRGGDALAMSREGARDEDESFEDMLGRCFVCVLVYDSCDWRLFDRDWLVRYSGSGGLRGMSTRVMVDDTPDARFMTLDSSTTLPFRRCGSECVSLLVRGAEMDDCEECVERLPE